MPNIYWFQCQYCEYLLPFFVVVLCDSTLNIFEILTVGRSKWTETNSLFSLALSHSPAKRSAEKNWPFLLSTANMIKDHPWEINDHVLCYKKCQKCILVKSLEHLFRWMQSWIWVSLCFVVWLLIYHQYLPLSHTYTHIHIPTLTCSFILSQLQPSRAVALIGVQQQGAAMAAASIVNVAACYLCTRQHREKGKMESTALFMV